MSTQKRSFLIGRDAKTGQFVPIEIARRHPGKYVVDNVSKSVSQIPKELRNIISHPPKDSNKKSSTSILEELRYEVKRSKR